MDFCLPFLSNGIAEFTYGEAANISTVCGMQRTSIKYSVAQDGFVNISIFNLLGEKVATLVNSSLLAGNYEVNFDASQLTSGVYFYSIEAGSFKAVRKMLLMK